jgi:hypothetical protein
MKIPMDLKLDIFKRANVVGVGRGKEGIVVYVRKKKPLAKLYPADVVGKSYDGVPTDVIESGEIRALYDPWMWTGPYSVTLTNAKQDVNVGRYRPAPAGVSIGHVKVTAGTLGYNVLLPDGKRYILTNNHVAAACFDEQTEVLTHNGFKYWQDVTESDEFATLNQETGDLEYQRPTTLIAQYYVGPMLHFFGKSIDALVTPNHRMYAKRVYHSGLPNHCRPRPFSRVEAQEMKDVMSDRPSVSYEFKADAKWNCIAPESISLPKTHYKKRDHNVESVPLDAWLEFLGRYISDGCAVTNSSSGQKIISIRETVPEELDHICDLVRECGFHPCRSKNGAVVINSKQLYKILRPLGGSSEKYIPQDIKGLPPEKLRIFLKGYMDADGCTDKANQYCATTASRRLWDDLQEVFLKCGMTFSAYVSRGSPGSYNPNGTYYNVRTKKLPSLRIPQIPSTIPYDGFVYCATVPNETLFVRRNGKTMWSGNSNDGVVGDPILQPGPHDEGQNPADHIANLYKFKLLVWINQFPPDVPCPFAQGIANALNWGARLFGSRSQLFPSRPYEEPPPEEPPPPWDPMMNRVDCALAEPLNQDDVKPGFISLPGVVDGTREGALDMPVQKEGRTSGVTKATIATLDLTTQVNYGEKYAWFTEQISTTALMEPGDSGSLVISLDGPPYKVIGLGFAGSTALSIINPISFVQEALGGFSFD